MRVACLLFLALAACWGDNVYIVEGVVVEVSSPQEVVIQHEDIPGFMQAMTMPFSVQEPGMLSDVKPGDRVFARLVIEEEGSYLDKLRVTGSGPVPEKVETGAIPVRPREFFPQTKVALTPSGEMTVGLGQEKPTVLTFLFTTCPQPEFCPALVARLQGLQEAIGTDAHILAVTIQPEVDTPAVLEAYAKTVGSNPEIWRFGRLEGKDLEALAMRGGLPMMKKDRELLHGIRLLVLDDKGRLIERYDDNNWPLERVVQQLRTGGPPAPPNTSGTATPKRP